MHPSLIVAQATTLKEWADIWERDGHMGTPFLNDDVVVYLRKAKHAMDLVVNPHALEDLGLQAYKVAEPIMGVKDG